MLPKIMESKKYHINSTNAHPSIHDLSQNTSWFLNNGEWHNYCNSSSLLMCRHKSVVQSYVIVKRKACSSQSRCSSISALCLCTATGCSIVIIAAKINYGPTVMPWTQVHLYGLLQHKIPNTACPSSYVVHILRQMYTSIYW